MVRIEKYDDQVVVKSPIEYFILGYAVIIMALIAIIELIIDINKPEMLTVSDYVIYSAIIVSCFLLCVYCFKNALAYITVDDHGVTYKDPFVKRSIPWHEIMDYGFSYTGHGKYGTQYYSFYFSDTVLKNKNYRSKRLKGNIIKFGISNSEYSEIAKRVMPICRKNIKSRPFIPKELLGF